MIAAGAGDMFGKYTSLLDWEFSKEINEEAYREEIAQDTRVALENDGNRIADGLLDSFRRCHAANG